jgi:uncharacterized protein YjeT (DUF2065 family)
MLVDRYVALALLITALSHLVQPSMWTHFFTKLVQAKIVAVAVAFYTLPLGLVLLLAHPDWRWGSQWLFIGLGLGFTIKSLIYLMAPQLAEKTVVDKGLDPKNMRIAGGGMLVLSVPLLWVAFS